MGTATLFSSRAPNMDSVDVFAALANPIRRDILMRLRRGPCAVNDLARGFDIGRPAVSEHLQVLRKAKLVREEPRGRERYYHLDPRPLSDIEVWLNAFTQYWKQRMIALEKVLEEKDRE
jgi:DNA-binding transcriptional ArsR family regulator